MVLDSETVVDPAAQTRREEARDLSPFAVSTLTLLVMLVYFWLSDALFPDDTTDFGMSSAQITGMALTYSTSPAFLLAALFYAQRRTRTILDGFVRSGSVSREAATSAAGLVSEWLAALGPEPADARPTTLSVDVESVVVHDVLGTTIHSDKFSVQRSRQEYDRPPPDF